jgi:DnaJ-class molecular chaperone
MQRKTYYKTLGVSHTESPSGIRAAYRGLAKRVHPDLAGEQSASAFREVTAAYEVLSDPMRRHEYDRQLARVEHGGTVEIHQAGLGPIVREPVTILGNSEGMRPSFEVMFDRFLRNFTGVGIPKSERLEGLNFEVLLTAEEVAHGCVVPVGVPIFRPCSQCGGTGKSWMQECNYCKQQGIVETETIVRVRIPPMTPLGTTFDVPLPGLGIHNFFLRLHVLRTGAAH